MFLTVIKLLLEHQHSIDLIPHCFFLEKLISKQRLKVKSFIVNTNNYLNEIFLLFNPLHKEFSPGFQLVDIFSNCFSFNTINHKINKVKIAYFCKLNKIFRNFLQNIKNVVVISNTSIKNNVAISIAHICLRRNIIVKIIYYAINIISTKAELFIIRYETDQVVQVTNAIYLVRHIFDSLSHSYQL